MTYKGYTAQIEIDEPAGILFGTVAGIRDVITFQGETVADFIQAFHDSVDDYLEWCAERGKAPQVPTAEPAGPAHQQDQATAVS